MKQRKKASVDDDEELEVVSTFFNLIIEDELTDFE